MHFLAREREVLERYAPGLEAGLVALGLPAAERVGSEAISLFRTSSAPGLLVPTECGGAGASALQALHFQIALGSRAPSIAVATTMHQYKIAALCQLRPRRALEEVLTDIAQNHWLVASAGAEGEPGRKIYEPTVTATDTPDGVRIRGTKKPCCLTWSMDRLTVMVRSAADSRYRGEFLHVVIDPKQPSVQREQFWNSPLLAAAESDAVTLNDTLVPEEYVFRVGSAESARPFALAAFAWFELLVCGAYLGVTCGLFELVVKCGRGTNALRAELASELDGVCAALERVAMSLDAGELGAPLVSRIFRVRYVTERRLPEIAGRCFRAMGGLALNRFPEVAYLEPVTRLLASHVPSFESMADNLAAQLEGEPLVLS